MKVFLTYDAALDAWTFSYDDVRVETLADVREWERQCRELMAPLKEPIDLLVDMKNLTIAPEMGPEYGALVKTFFLPRCKAVVRYGSSRGMTVTTIQLQATVQRFPANVLPDRASAIAMLEQIRKSRQ